LRVRSASLYGDWQYYTFEKAQFETVQKDIATIDVRKDFFSQRIVEH